ncbi:MAG: hypothetical protein K5945_03800 [Bacteroidaceae bacterium]|nr:hypothetical protein [Bacteroidaceae bacterium]
MGCEMASSQTSDVVKELNERRFWFPSVMWLQSDDRMEGFLRNIDDYSEGKFMRTLRSLDDDHNEAQELIKVITKIGGKKKGKKQDERLARRFNDIEAVKRALDAAEQACVRYDRLKGAISERLKHMQPAAMPAGQLLYFHYTTNNAFAGYKQEVILDGRKGKHELKMEVQRMGEPSLTPLEGEGAPKEVGDSVFQRVRDMVEQGQLYEVGREYMPDYKINDAPSWSLQIVFEQGSIDSSGYAERPDHDETLREIVEYLLAISK